MMLDKSTPDPPMPTFADVEAAWSRDEHALRDMTVQHEAMTTARDLAPLDQIPDRAFMARDRAAPYLARAKRHPARFEVEIEDIELAIETAKANIQLTRDRYAEARQHEADRIAAGFQARQKIAVANVASALEAFSVALAAAESIHTEFDAVSPQASALMPNFYSAFAGCRLDKYSTASLWAERARSIGILS